MMPDAVPRDHWSRWFTVLGIESDTPAGLAQDIVTLRVLRT